MVTQYARMVRQWLGINVIPIIIIVVSLDKQVVFICQSKAVRRVQETANLGIRINTTDTFLSNYRNSEKHYNMQN